MRRRAGIVLALLLVLTGCTPAEPAGPAAEPAAEPVYMALTFDDGPSAHTARILDCLEANDSRATFYMVGNRMGSYQSTVKRMVDMGCEPGSHTWDHTYITKLSQEGLFANLNRLDDTLQSIAGVRTVTMRPPGGFVQLGNHIDNLIL